MSSERIDRGYSVVRAVADPLRGSTRPIGTVAWDSDRQWYAIRLVSSEENLPGLGKSRRVLVDLNARQLERWAEERRVPYTEGTCEPWQAGFWQAVRRALTAGVVLDEPKAMEPLQNPDEFEALFEAVVQPRETTKKRTARIDGALTNALGPLADEVRSGLKVRAFAQRRETVMRGAKGPNGVVVVEGVNLASKEARKDADALVSRLLRVRRGEGDERVRVVIGYRSSPGGLNGESDLRDWMIDQITPSVFDVNRQATELRRATALALGETGARDEGLFRG